MSHGSQARLQCFFFPVSIHTEATLQEGYCAHEQRDASKRGLPPPKRNDGRQHPGKPHLHALLASQGFGEILGEHSGRLRGGKRSADDDAKHEYNGDGPIHKKSFDGNAPIYPIAHRLSKPGPTSKHGLDLLQ